MQQQQLRVNAMHTGLRKYGRTTYTFEVWIYLYLIVFWNASTNVHIDIYLLHIMHLMLWYSSPNTWLRLWMSNVSSEKCENLLQHAPPVTHEHCCPRLFLLSKVMTSFSQHDIEVQHVQLFSYIYCTLQWWESQLLFLMHENCIAAINKSLTFTYK